MPNKEYDDNWDELPRFAGEALKTFNEIVGEYPYPQQLFRVVMVEMEYPMIT